MKVYFLIKLIFLFSYFYGQNDLSSFNSDYSISDSLNKKEIRIYRSLNYGENCNSMLRLYESINRSWLVEFYECGEKNLINLHSNEIERIYFELLKNNTLEMISLESIKWKLNNSGKVFINEETGKYNVEYIKKSAPSHGPTFTVMVRLNERSNKFSYYCPQELYKYYPEIDELIYMNSLIKTITENIKIWKY